MNETLTLGLGSILISVLVHLLAAAVLRANLKVTDPLYRRLFTIPHLIAVGMPASSKPPSLRLRILLPFVAIPGASQMAGRNRAALAVARVSASLAVVGIVALIALGSFGLLT